MSGAPAEIDIIATDEASEVFQDVSSNFSAMSNDVSEASEQTSTAVTQSNQSFSTSAMQMNTLAMSGAMLYMAVNNVENSEVSLSRAHLTEEKAANAVTLAQQAYNKAVAEYGPTSLQAQDAAKSLSLAEQTQGVDAQRVGDAQRNYNSTLIMSALTVIPSVIGVLTTLNSLQEAGTLAKAADTIATDAWAAGEYVAYGATQAATGAMGLFDAVCDANPIMLVVLAVAALAAIFYEAYEHCKPFREIINDVGHVVGGAVLTAFNALKGAAEYLWNDAIKPGITILEKLWGTITGNPILSALFGPITAIVYLVEHWSDVTKAVGAAFSWLWNDVLVPVGNFFKTVFVDSINVAMIPIKAFETAIGAVANAVKPLSDLIGGLGSALSHLCFAHAAPAAEEFNKQVTQSIALSDQLTHKTNTLGSSLQGLAGNVSVKGGAGTSNVTIGAPTIQIGSVTGSASLKQTRDAVSKGLCDAMYKKGLMNKVL